MNLKISDILAFLDSQNIEYTFQGDVSNVVEGFSSLKNYRTGTFTWVKNEKAIGLMTDEINLAFVQDDLDVEANNTIHSAQSKLGFFSTIENFYYKKPKRVAIGANTFISPSVKLGKGVVIGANCTLDGDIEIGDNTLIGNNVVIVDRVKIGANCEIHSGCVIGHDGFGWTEDENHVKTMLKHYGGVSIGNDVLICPNCVIDKGTIDDTVIKNGVKIDALCFIAHNVVIEENAILITGSKLYGSSIVSKNAYIATGIVRNQCSIGENALVGLGAVVTKSVPDNVTVVGNPAKPLKAKE